MLKENSVSLPIENTNSRSYPTPYWDLHFNTIIIKLQNRTSMKCITFLQKDNPFLFLKVPIVHSMFDNSIMTDIVFS